MAEIDGKRTGRFRARKVTSGVSRAIADAGAVEDTLVATANGTSKRRKRKSYKELFLEELKKQSQGEQRLVGNETIRNSLVWNSDRYNRIKADLVEDNSILGGRGRGGTVGLTNAPGALAPKAVQIFISYSHADEALKAELVKHLELLKRLKLVEDWQDRIICPGDK